MIIPVWLSLSREGEDCSPVQRGIACLLQKNILQNITKDEPLSVTDLNINTAFKVAWAGFIRMGELTYTAAEAKKATFAETGLTRSDISFAEGDQYAILCLKRNKSKAGLQRIVALASALKRPKLQVFYHVFDFVSIAGKKLSQLHNPRPFYSAP